MSGGDTESRQPNQVKIAHLICMQPASKLSFTGNHVLAESDYDTGLINQASS